MPRITHVKAAQQRYERVPVIDEDTGQPKVTSVNRTTKSGRAVTMAVTRDDRSKPLPPYTCGYCHEPIAIGTPYKHISPKSGPYGGRTLRRHESCPTWQVWDYSSSLSARLAQIEHEFSTALADAAGPDDVTSALETAAESVRELAGEKRESSEAIVEGFQHSTSQSDELEEQADALESWADEIENVSVPEYPEPEEEDCGECAGTGKIVQLYEDSDPEPWRPGSYAEGVVRDCGECEGTGQVTPDEPTDDQVDEWRGEVESETSIVGEPPV
jgi:hypothetical protein